MKKSDSLSLPIDSSNPLYHYTSQLWLPGIMKKGIYGGELSVDPSIPYLDRPKAVNLTTNPDPYKNMQIWASAHKTHIRLTVAVPPNELVTFRQFREHFKVPEKHLKLLCPYEERKRWFYVFRTVTVAEISRVEILDGGAYRALAGTELSDRLRAIEIEMERAVEINIPTSGRLKGARLVTLRDGISSSWLCDEPATMLHLPAHS